MASATAKPPRRLGELLQEKQDPFVLEVYLLERSFARKIVAAARERPVNGQYRHGSTQAEKSWEGSTTDILKRKKVFPQYLRLLKAVSKILSISGTKKSLSKNDDLSNSQTAKVHNAGTYYSCSESNAEKPSALRKIAQKSATEEINQALNAHNYGVAEFKSNKGLQAIEDVQEKPSNGPDNFHEQEISRDKEDLKLHHVKTNVRQGPHSHRHSSISKSEKITEDMILSASLSHMSVQSVEERGMQDLMASQLSQMLKSKGILQQTKQLLFDCVREISTNNPFSCDKAQHRNIGMSGPEEVGKLIFEKLEQWGNQDGDETNIHRLLTADNHNSDKEWTDFETQKRDIGIEIGDAIFKDIHNEIVSEIIYTLIKWL